MKSTVQCVALGFGILTCLACAAMAQTGSLTTSIDHAANVAALAKQLRWRDKVDATTYERTKAELTKTLLTEIDQFIYSTFYPKTANTDQIKAGVDAILGRKEGDIIQNHIFGANLRRARFVIACFELWRGGKAINEDAASCRAYRDDGNRFVFVASTEDLKSSDPQNSYLVSLRVEALTDPLIDGEVRLIALAEVPPRTPPMVAVRLFGFDGYTFRTLWSPRDFMAENVDRVLEIVPGGFRVNSLSDPTGRAALSPTAVLHRQYALTRGTPEEVAEWSTTR